MSAQWHLQARQIESIPEALGFWAAATPDAIALIEPGLPPVTYRELHEAVEQLAAALRARGLGGRDGLALLFPDGLELYLALLAAISAGIAVPLAWPNPESEYRQVLANRRVKAVLTSAEIPLALTHLPTITLAAGPSGRIGDFHLAGPGWGEPAAASLPGPSDIALILHSSGTTGRPKLIPRLHRNIVANCRAVTRVRAATAADRCLSIARATYSQGFNVLMFTLFSGASLVRGSGLDMDALPQWVRTYEPTYISTTPAVLRLLSEQYGELREAFRQSPLTRIHSSAGALSPGDLERIEEALGVPILNGYGMSEASGIAGEPYPRMHRVPGAVGPPWCDLTVLSEEDVPLGSGEVGQIVVRGPTVFPGYLDDAAANAATFLPGGWFCTGDLGFLDDGGYVHLTGRLTEVINRGGEKIVPREVDDVLMDHSAVAEAAIFGVPDARLGEDAVAAVVVNLHLPQGHNVTALSLREWMLDRLAAYKVPRRIWLVDRLPRTPTGKVRRGELARLWSEEQG
jgi:acyl-CoA synthetase (AMP-forming)/AMP-acid ligase II